MPITSYAGRRLGKKAQLNGPEIYLRNNRKDRPVQAKDGRGHMFDKEHARSEAKSRWDVDVGGQSSCSRTHPGKEGRTVRGKRGKLNPRYCRHLSTVLAKVEKVATGLELPQELSRVHPHFPCSNS
ncbi:hypothetical protein Tco_1376537 [Tanacetum coccineum]